MSGSINKVILVGNVGNEPEIRVSQSGGNEIANLSIATSERWKDKTSGEQKEKTDWHRIVVFAPGLVNLVKNYVRKGSKLYVEGKLQTREYTDQEGNKKYTTEVILSQFNSTIMLMDSKTGDQANINKISFDNKNNNTSSVNDDYDAEEIKDEIPF